MIYIACFIFIFTILQAITALINLIFLPRLKTSPHHDDHLVSVLIPVRNEERNIPVLLNDLIRQEYKNIEILVFDDESQDHTASIIKELAKLDSRIRLITSSGLPEGWLGKMHACNELSRHAKGTYLLFADADVRILKNALQKAIGYMHKHSLGLLSVFPRQDIKTWGEWLTVPIMNYILLSLLPLVFVRTSGFVSHSAANGQFMLFDASVYRKYLPHEKMRMNPVEDIAISRWFKRNQIPVACHVGDDTIRCRMYKGFGDAVHGFSKNIIAFFGNSFLLAFLFWFVTTAGIFFIVFTFPVNLTLIYLGLYLFIKIAVSIVSNQHILRNVACILPHQIVMGVILFRALIYKWLKPYTWKGRSV